MDLIAALLDPEVYPDAASRIECIQTHISYIFLTESHAYKIKKPVNFGFLDFSTLRKRRHFLDQELVLNRRLARNLSCGAASGRPARETADGWRGQSH